MVVTKRKVSESFDEDSSSNDTNSTTPNKFKKNDEIDTNNNNTTTTTTTTTTSSSTSSSSSTSTSSPRKEEILKILTNDNVKNLNVVEMKEWFKEISFQLLNNVVLMINEQAHMLVEIEFYFKGCKHIDHFTHGDSMQLERGTWYFHRSGSGYKGGSFKGLDITFGLGDSDDESEKKTYGGILIRSIQILSDKSIIDGPSLCVDHILKTTNSKDISQFIRSHGRSIFENENSSLYLKMRDQVLTNNNSGGGSSGGSSGNDDSGENLKSLTLPPIVSKSMILSCPRVGLTLKRYKPSQEFFIGGDYRFIRLPDKVKKGKHYMTVKLALLGQDSNTIKNQVGSTTATIEKIKAQIKAGEKLSKSDLSSFRGDLSADEMCKLLGLCNKLYNEKINSSNGEIDVDINTKITNDGDDDNNSDN
ncbi:hypothetical protein DDB_G0281981 [Dictyostelium discoideum AX4]|uniref:Uncharacterized protein n=1 Tax=Dictyostelium discoideum TaxID=44689 RepID=Q54T61_DICDI|nr:hypothetical protein DDB_G0281981 [Dictyostelium discoideum AX4]EAL66412.1 hypothetical protein DDB_G0281981 [Dictyostelium discoideum AX4]|eukprot:XP_640390.1 hypothetical protein DDB_G0281981 [Dictyostelium discoideum AX4]